MDEILDCIIKGDLKKLKKCLKEIGVNGKVFGTDGFTPLHVVAGIDPGHNLEDILSYLFDNGADPNGKSDEDLTPVHIAAMWNRCFQLEKLLEQGGDPWLTDIENKNAFDMAADNHCYEAYQLLNLYHAAGKLNFKPEKKELKKLTFATPECFTTPKSNKNSFADDSLNQTFMSCKSPKFTSPSVFSTPRNFVDSRLENLNESQDAECTFMSAKEHFPVIFSSNDESGDISDASEFLQKLTLAKSDNYFDSGRNNDGCSNVIPANNDNYPSDEPVKCDSGTISNHNNCGLKDINDKEKKDEEKDRDMTEISITNTNGEKQPGNQKCKKSLNKAYIFSSSSESSGTTTSDLNESDDSTCGTIIDSNDMSDIVLVETKNETVTLCSSNSSVCSVPNDWKSFHSVVRDCSVLSNCSSHSKSTLVVPEEIERYSNSKIFEELKKKGDNPGPVLDHTRHVYLHRLARLISGCAMSCELPKPKYCPEIYLFLKDKLDMDRADYLEQMIEEEFDAEMSKEWREGNQRCCFNYFLLDPRVTQNLPHRANQLTDEQTFLTFLDALFYVGKGTKGRPYSHLFEAAKSIEDNYHKSAKVNHIIDIWDSGLGVISLHCFHNSIPVEAYTREACIIEAVGLDNLTNIRKGDYYGLCSKLTSSRKRLIGISLLHKALQIFLLEGERLIRPKDIRRKPSK